MNTGVKHVDKADKQEQEQETWHEKRARHAMTVETRNRKLDKPKPQRQVDEDMAGHGGSKNEPAKTKGITGL